MLYVESQSHQLFVPTENDAAMDEGISKQYLSLSIFTDHGLHRGTGYNVEETVLAFYESGGYLRYPRDATAQEVINEIKKDIPLFEDQKDCINNYLSSIQEYDDSLFGCATCGIYAANKVQHRISVDVIKSLLKVPEVLVQSIDADYRKYHTWMQFDENYYYLFHQFVNENEATLCNACNTALVIEGTLPLYCPASGYDFG